MLVPEQLKSVRGQLGECERIVPIPVAAAAWRLLGESPTGARQRAAPRTPFSSENTISTRRFIALPRSEALASTGYWSP